MKRLLYIGVLSIAFFFKSNYVAAQHERTQYPFFLSNHTYFEASVSYIGYHFSNLQMERGYVAESVHIPHTGVRLVLYGYRFNQHLAVQVSYMRPVLWIQYKNVNGDHASHSVPTNVAGLTFKWQQPLNKRFMAYTEAGLGIITRSGFSVDNVPVVKSSNYASLLVGGGISYRFSEKLQGLVGGGLSPAYSKDRQPATFFFSGGVTYNVRRLPQEQVERNKNTPYFFPANLVQVGYITNAAGYGVNNFFANPVFPIFWGGDVQVKSGISVHYQRNIFHSHKVFSLDWGVSFSYYKSKNQNTPFYAASLFPLARFTAFHSKKADLYFNYSVAGPTFISKTTIDETKTGKRFTFQDFMGMGVFAGKTKRINVEIRIAHYSNGDLFPDNNGVMVPLSINAGYTF